MTRVVAPVDIEGRTESFESAVRLEARDQQGDLVAGRGRRPRDVDVKIEIEQAVVQPGACRQSGDWWATPRQGYNVVGVTVEPPVVTVFGPEAYIEEAVSDIDSASGHRRRDRGCRTDGIARLAPGCDREAAAGTSR